MTVEQLDDAASFLLEAGPYLLAEEARNNLPLGIAATVRDHPGVYPEHRFWVVREEGGVLGAALRTPPYNLVLAGPTPVEGLGALVRSLTEAESTLPGVTGAVPEVDAFVHVWQEETGARARARMSHGVYRLERLRPPRGVAGRAREAVAADRPLLVRWLEAFSREAAPDGGPARDVARAVDARLEEGAGGFTIWEDGEPVSLAGWGGRTPNGARIGPVYTPPGHRRRGYGSAVTAAVSAELLAAGCSFCFLYTDLANPTANHIYAELGYEPVCDARDVAFGPRLESA